MCVKPRISTLNPYPYNATHRESVIIFNRMRLIIVPLQHWDYQLTKFEFLPKSASNAHLPMSNVSLSYIDFGEHMEKRRNVYNRTNNQKKAIAVLMWRCIIEDHWTTNILHKCLLFTCQSSRENPTFISRFFFFLFFKVYGGWFENKINFVINIWPFVISGILRYAFSVADPILI